MFAGGIADKLGNQYEAKWIVLQLLHVIGGKSAALTYEGIDSAFKGFECSITRNGVTEWHQTKISSPKGNWTLNALNQEGVLDAFKRRFTSSNIDLCVFVSQTPANAASGLVAKAKIARDADEFVRSLGKQAGEEFKKLKDIWVANDETSFAWLRRSQFRVQDQTSIESMIDTFCDWYFEKGAKTGFAILSEFLTKRFNQEITTDKVRAAISEEGKLKFKDYKLNPTLAQELREATENYLKTYIPFGAGREVIVRQEAQLLKDRIFNPNGPAIILLTGVAGSGKSGVIRELIASLSSRSTTHLAFRVDHHLDCKSPQAFGKEILGREESPVTTLKSVSTGHKSVLIVDQVDAVSEVSGRNGAIKQAVLRLVDDARNLGNVVIVISCRTFDLENDDRLKALKTDRGVEHVNVELLDWEAAIKPLLLSQSIEVEQFSVVQIELLRLPLNLALFFETCDSSAPAFNSRNELFRLLLEKKRRVLGIHRTILWDVLAPLARLAEWMSEQQRLDAPDNVLSQFGGALNILPSEGLVVRSRGRISFFHESFFDYIYALTFSKRNLTLKALLLQTEQHLFRRTQVRQILENLRQEDKARYVRELRSIIGNPAIRYHIQVAAAKWLGSLNDPTQQEREIVLSVDRNGGPFPLIVRSALFASAGWFDNLHENGWVSDRLVEANPERVEAVFWWLSHIASQRPVEIADLLGKWWGDNPERAIRLLNWFDFVRKAEGPLVDLCARVIRSNPPRMFEGRNQNYRDFPLHTWAGENHHGAEKILKAYFDAWFEAHPGLHPFKRDEFRDNDEYPFAELSEKAPVGFIEGTIETFIRSVDSVVLQDPNGARDYSFSMRYASGPNHGPDAFLKMFRGALMKLACDSSDKAREILRRIDPDKHEVCTHIWLEAISANGKALSDLFVEVMDREHIFDAGWTGAEWQSFATAAHAALPHLDPAGIAKFDKLILSYKPEISLASHTLQQLTAKGEQQPWRMRERIVKTLNLSGYEVWCILETIGEELLSQASRRLFCELRRKFQREKLPEAIDRDFREVESPIKREKAKRMTDEHWLSAMLKYDNNERRFDGRIFLAGGSSELANELQQQAKEQPQRFSTFLKKMPEGTNPDYVSHLLWGLAESEVLSIDALKSAILTAHEKEERAYGREIARLIEKRPEVAVDAEIFSTLLWYVENGDANESDAVDASNTKHEAATIDDLLSGSRLHVRGVNGARGAAAEALGQVLWHVPKIVEEAWSVVEHRAEVEPLVSVRCCLVRAAVPLYNFDKKRCATLMDRLSRQSGTIKQPVFLAKLWVRAAFPSQRLPQFAKAASVKIASIIERVARRSGSDSSYYLAPLTTHHGIRLLPYILNSPEAGRQLLHRMLVQGDENTRAIGAWLVFSQSFYKDAFRPLADLLARDGVVYRRLLADVASNAVENAEYRYRAEAVLRSSFNDADKQVRSQASNVFRHVKSDQFLRYRALAFDFIRSRAFEAGSYSFFRAVRKAECKVDDIVIAAVEALMSDISKNGNAAGRRTMDLHQLTDIIKNEYTTSENDPKLRTKLLDLIDNMMRAEVYGVEDIVSAHER